MFAVIAGVVFSAAFLLALAVIITMLMAYRDKMVAALLFDPIPETTPVYSLRVSRRRAEPLRRPLVRPAGALAA